MIFWGSRRCSRIGPDPQCTLSDPAPPPRFSLLCILGSPAAMALMASWICVFPRPDNGEGHGAQAHAPQPCTDVAQILLGRRAAIRLRLAGLRLQDAVRPACRCKMATFSMAIPDLDWPLGLWWQSYGLGCSQW